MKSVTRFEANLLRILWFFLGRVPAEQALPLLTAAHPRPRCLTRPAVECVQDALAKGTMLILAHGGWHRERFLRNEKVVEGRIWERTAPEALGLDFSPLTMEFLIWITEGNPKEAANKWTPDRNRLSIGDRLLCHLAFASLRDSDLLPSLRGLTPWFNHGLCWLTFPEVYAGTAKNAKPDFAPWTTGVGGCILEAMQSEIAERWLAVEQGKGRIADAGRMRALGQSQERVLTSYLDAIDAVGRRDLARFLLATASRLLDGRPTAANWIGTLDVRNQRVADRMETYRSAFALLRSLDRLRQWDREARAVGYFDEGYSGAQLWKSDWDRLHGDALCETAAAVMREVEPLGT